MEGYKEIYLEYRSRPYIVTPQAYEQVKAIIQASLICKFCLRAYSEANPQVAENVCLGCFLLHRDVPPRDLTFVGEATSEYAIRSGYKTYKFLDSQGYVYLIHSTNPITDPLNRDIAATLRHYGYTPPEKYTLKGGTEVDLETGSWRTMYGDFKTIPVLLVTYKEYYGNHLEAEFMLYRDGTSVEFTKRKNPMRQWYNEAKAEIEATYKPNQGYIVSTGLDGEDRTSYRLYDSHMYPGIVARACLAYEQEKGGKAKH